MYSSEKAFAEEVVRIVDQLLQDCTVTVQEKVCVNDVVHYGINVKSVQSNVAPVVPMPTDYNSVDVMLFAKSIVERVKVKNEMHIDLDSIISTWKSNVYVMLVDTAKNQEFLKNYPHREFLNLSMIAYLRLDAINSNPDSNCSTKITYGFLKVLEVSEDDLLDIAFLNTIHEPIIIDDLQHMLTGTAQAPNFMHIVTNKVKYLGATVMLHKDVMLSLHEIFDGDFYVIPSSIHEILAVPAHGFENATDYDTSGLLQIVKCVNQECVDKEEVLTDSLYFYNSKTERLELVSV